MVSLCCGLYDSMLIYISIYLALMLAVFFESASDNSRDKNFLILVLIGLLSLVRALRWKTGTDWDLYCDAFYSIDTSNVFMYLYNDFIVLEPGYALLNLIVRSLGFNYTGFLLVVNVFILISYYIFVKKYSSHPLLSFSFLIATNLIFPVRQTIAVAITLFGIGAIIRRQPIKFIAIIAIATTFHVSAVVVLPFYFFAHRKINYKMLFIAYGGSVILGASHLFTSLSRYFLPLFSGLFVKVFAEGSIFTEKLNAYIDNPKAVAPFAAKQLVTLAYQSLLLLVFKRTICKDESKSELSPIFLNLYVFGLCISWLFMSQEFARSQDYFVITFSILVGAAFQSSKKGLAKLLGLELLLTWWFLKNTILFEYSSAIIPYQTIFDFTKAPHVK